MMMMILMLSACGEECMYGDQTLSSLGKKYSLRQQGMGFSVSGQGLSDFSVGCIIS